MTENKKKIVPILLSIAIIGGIVVLRLNQKANAESNQEKSKQKVDPLFGNDPNFSLSNSDDSSYRELVFRTIASVAIVITLGAVAIYVSKKFRGRLGNLQDKKINIVETAHLGPHKKVHLVKIGNQQLLIGSTNDNITMLADVTGASNSQSFSKTLDEMDFSTNQANTVNASQ